MTDLGLCLIDNAHAPYPGLRPFKPEESSIFCGREAAIDDVVARLGERNLVLVHGGSGCGKSSLVRAGVLPLLARRHELAGRSFGYAIIRPSEGPLTQLAAVLAQRLGTPEDVGAAAENAVRWWSEKIIFDRDIVTHLEAAIERKRLQSFVLIVDQFEEIFPWTRDRGRSDVDLLVNFLARVGGPEPGRRLFVLVTMRSDYIGPCAQFAKLGPLINDCQYFLRNMDDAGIASAIVEPAVMFGGKIDPPLLSHLMFAAAAQTDPLPILQHSLMRMAAPYLGAADWKLKLEDLKRVSLTADGKDSNALSVHANEALASVISAQGKPRENALLDGARWVFRALFELDVGGKAIRRPREFAKLVSVSGLEMAEVHALVKAFGVDGVNLLTDIKGSADARMIDISHEALLRNWDRMAGTGGKQGGWIREEFEDAVTWRMLARYASNRRVGDAVPPTEPSFMRRLLESLNRAVLDARTTRQVIPLMANMTIAPERARRYLLQSTNLMDIRDESEWRDVRAMIVHSRRMELGKGVAGWLAIAGGIAFFYSNYTDVVQQYDTEIQDKATQDASVAAILSSNARKIEDLNNEVSAAFPVDAAAKRQQTIEAAAANEFKPSVTSGVIWTGDARTSNLRDLLGQKVIGRYAVKDQRYIVTQPVKIREKPDGERRGALKRNTAVVAAENGFTADNGQYWLNIKVTLLPTLYIQYNDSSSTTAATALRRVFANQNFIVPQAQLLPQAANLREVRYCYQADTPAANRVADIVGTTLGGGRLRVNWIGRSGACQKISKEGTIELWLDSIARQ